MAVEFSLRQATAEDLESIQRIYYYLVGSPIGQEWVWHQLIKEGSLIVTEVDGKISGFGGIDVAAVEQLKWLYVLPEYQGAGVGTEMLKRLEEIGWTNGLNTIRLHSAPAAVKFYRRHGYEEVEPQDDLAHDHEGLAMMKGRGD